MGRKKKEDNIKQKKPENIELNKTLYEIQKKFGKESIKFASELKDKGKILFGIKELDEFTSGIKRGNFCIAYGGASVGKTTLSMHAIKWAQENNLKCAYVDLEKTFDLERAKIFGIDLSKLLYIDELDYAEEAMDIVVTLSKEKMVDFIVVDSIQAFSPKDYFEDKKGKEKSVGDDFMALLPKKIGRFIDKTRNHIANAKIGVLLIGQVRMDIGGFIAKEGLTGGNALKHASTLTLYMRRGQKADAPLIKIEKEVEDKGTIKKKKFLKLVGFDCVFKIEKMKISGCQPEGSELHIKFDYDTGFLKDTNKEYAVILKKKKNETENEENKEEVPY